MCSIETFNEILQFLCEQFKMTILVIFIVGGHKNLALLRNNKGPPKNMSLKRVVAPDGETTVGTSQVVPPTPGTDSTRDGKRCSF